MSTQTSPAKTVSRPNQGNAKPPRLMVPFMKMPLILYRLGLGRVFGERFMLLTHAGRRSGKTYRTVLVALHHDKRSHEIWAVSPWSASNWYRNIQAAPALAVETAGVRYAPVQRSLSPEEIAAAFVEFRRRYPVFSRMVARIPGWKIDSTEEELLELARSLRGVAFQPRPS